MTYKYHLFALGAMLFSCMLISQAPTPIFADLAAINNDGFIGSSKWKGGGTILIDQEDPMNSESSIARIQSIKNIPKIDFHAHYRYEREFLIPFLDDFNMQALLVDVVRTVRGRTVRSWAPYVKMNKKYPEHFYLCSGFNADGIDEPGYAEKIINQLKLEIEEGARLVKVWKNFGMVHKDVSGLYVQINDPRLQPIWDFLIQEQIPVLAHIGEPLQAWTPLDSTNPHHNYFANNPQYHAYLHPEIPRYETIIGARDEWLEQNPALVVVAAHLGSMSHDVDEVAKRLDRFPNLSVEPGARFGDLTGQDSKKVKKFMEKYQDRILYGSDLSITQPAEDQAKEAIQRNQEFITKILHLHWKYFTTDEPFLFDSPMISKPVQTSGLNLPESILRKIYYENASRILKLN